MAAESNLPIQWTYDAATDILFFFCPDLTPLTLAQVNQGFQEVVKVLMTQNISRLLVDSSNAVIKVPGEQHNAIMQVFVLNLFSTKLKKLARVVSSDALREERVQEMAQNSQLSFEFRNFADVPTAVKWLSA